MVTCHEFGDEDLAASCKLEFVRSHRSGGGPEIQFKNLNGNIYIRKAGANKGD